MYPNHEIYLEVYTGNYAKNNRLQFLIMAFQAFLNARGKFMIVSCFYL